MLRQGGSAPRAIRVCRCPGAGGGWQALEFGTGVGAGAGRRHKPAGQRWETAADSTGGGGGTPAAGGSRWNQACRRGTGGRRGAASAVGGLGRPPEGFPAGGGGRRLLWRAGGGGASQLYVLIRVVEEGSSFTAPGATRRGRILRGIGGWQRARWCDYVVRSPRGCRSGLQRPLEPGHVPVLNRTSGRRSRRPPDLPEAESLVQCHRCGIGLAHAGRRRDGRLRSSAPRTAPNRAPSPTARDRRYRGRQYTLDSTVVS